MNIVCATDFTENAAHAADAAVSIAERFKVNLTLVHAVNRPAMRSLPAAMHDTWTGEAAGALRKLAKKLSVRDPDVASKLLIGVPDEAIIEHACQTQPDLVVMGSLGVRNLDEWVLGSSAERVADASPRPILLVRDSDPFRNWVEKNEPLRICVAYAFDRTSDLALRYLDRWKAAGPLHITVAHVDWPPEQYARFGLQYGMLPTHNDPILQGILERDVRRKVSEHLSTDPVEIVIEPANGRIDAHLTQMIQTARPDLVICGTHQRTGLSRFWRGSVSLELARRCGSNILLVPSPLTEEIRIPVHREILVATDFKEAGNEAAQRAYSLLPAGGVVYLLHVTEPHHKTSNLVPNTESQTYTPADHVRHLKSLNSRLQSLTPADAERQGCQTR